MMVILSFIAMYIFMYAMVDRPANVYPNVNQFYMAGLMAAPMLLIELALMSSMYPNKTWNTALIATAVTAMLAFWIGIRQQTAVSDSQFVRSMIPHHAGAILMCGKASLKDAELKALCENIMSGQQREIDQMKAKMKELSG